MNLDDKQQVLGLDPADLNASLSNFHNQCRQGWESAMQLEIPEDYANAKQIVCLAMGGSVLGGIIIKEVFKKELKVPFDNFSDYFVPGFVGEDTLAIVVSNSGTTEETLSSFDEAHQKTNKIIGITKGKDLGERCKQNGYPVYFIDDVEFNPSSVPRVAVAFQLGAYVGIFSKLGFLDITEADFLQIVDDLEQIQAQISTDVPTENNLAKQIAGDFKQKFAIFIGCEHLAGVSKSWNNQYNESAKSMSANFILPDVNHHQLEGMQFPKTNPDTLRYLLMESDLFFERNTKRINVLKNLLEDLGITYTTYKPTSSTKLGQALETFIFGSYQTYYLGLLNEVDPAPNPFVDEFKRQLKA